MLGRRGSFVALLAAAIALSGLAACPERALAPPEFTDGGLRDLSAIPDLASYDGFDMATLRPNPCPAGTEFIYTIDEDTTLSRFNPMTSQFFDVGKINCPTLLGSNPNSMAINRDGEGWVNFDSGELFKLTTATGTCTSTSYAPGQGGLTAFGMSFAQNSPGSLDETLFVADTAQGASTSLGTINLTNFKLATQIPIIGGIQPELTGDDDANLWGFFPSDSPPRIARIDKKLGTLDRVHPLPFLNGNPQAWGVAAYRGDFYVFLQRDVDASTNIYRVDGTTGTLSTVVASTGRRIVGVGVATCAGDNGLE